MAPRKKVTLNKPGIDTHQELHEVVGLVAQDMLAERNLKNALDAELQAVRAKYEAELADLASQIEQRTELCADYCAQHPDLLPRDAKSLDLGQAVIGFRTGTPKVKLLKRWTLAAVLAAVKGRQWFQFIRVVEELDKEAVLAQREKLGDALATVGLAVVQEETFFIAPKLQTQPAGVKVEAA